jgi:hypothetical protein
MRCPDLVKGIAYSNNFVQEEHRRAANEGEQVGQKRCSVRVRLLRFEYQRHDESAPRACLT